MKVKVCGMRDPDNLEAVLRLPVDMLGFIFYPPSPRYAGEREDLAEWIQAHEEAFGEVERVGVFVNAQIDEILNAVHDYRLHYVQLHGKEPPEYLRELKKFWDISSSRPANMVKAFGVDEAFDPALTRPYEPFCDFFIFDTQTPLHGGSGERFDWSRLEAYQGQTPFLLSGGIGPESAPALRAWSHPQWMGVDLNSRFELEPGRKDPERLQKFLRELRPDTIT